MEYWLQKNPFHYPAGKPFTEIFQHDVTNIIS